MLKRIKLEIKKCRDCPVFIRRDFSVSNSKYRCRLWREMGFEKTTLNIDSCICDAKFCKLKNITLEIEDNQNETNQAKS